MKRDERVFFESVYTDSFPLLYRVVLRLVGDTTTAEEICHDAYLRFYENTTKLPTAEEARYWLLRVGRNLAYNVSKRRVRERRALERAYRLARKKEESAAEWTLQNDTQERVRAAVARLPRNLRDVIVLKEYGGMAYAEIAQALTIKVSNVKVRAYRARVRLRQLLEVEDVHFPPGSE